VLVADGVAATEDELPLLLPTDKKGSFISPLGETLMGLLGDLLEVGEVRRESVLRKVDLRFGGGGRESWVKGRAGTLSCSLSLVSRSRISIAERVRVRLWVGAGKGQGQEEDRQTARRRRKGLVTFDIEGEGPCIVRGLCNTDTPRALCCSPRNAFHEEGRSILPKTTAHT